MHLRWIATPFRILEFLLNCLLTLRAMAMACVRTIEIHREAAVQNATVAQQFKQQNYMLWQNISKL